MLAFKINPIFVFQGESITFRATTAGVLTTLQHCLEIIAENDEIWRKKLDREIEKRKRTEEQTRRHKDEIEKFKRISYPGPDLEVSENLFCLKLLFQLPLKQSKVLFSINSQQLNIFVFNNIKTNKIFIFNKFHAEPIINLRYLFKFIN